MTTKTIAQKKIVIEAVCEKCDGTGVMPAILFFPTYMRERNLKIKVSFVSIVKVRAGEL